MGGWVNLGNLDRSRTPEGGEVADFEGPPVPQLRQLRGVLGPDLWAAGTFVWGLATIWVAKSIVRSG